MQFACSISVSTINGINDDFGNLSFEIFGYSAILPLGLGVSIAMIVSKLVLKGQ